MSASGGTLEKAGGSHHGPRGDAKADFENGNSDLFGDATAGFDFNDVMHKEEPDSNGEKNPIDSANKNLDGKSLSEANQPDVNAASQEDLISAAIVKSKQEISKLKRAAQKMKTEIDMMKKENKELESRLQTVEKEKHELLEAKRAAESNAELLENKYKRAIAEASTGAAGREKIAMELETQIETISADKVKAEQDRDSAMEKWEASKVALRTTEMKLQRSTEEISRLKKLLSEAASREGGNTKATEIDEKIAEARDAERKEVEVELENLKKRFKDAYGKYNQLRATATKLKAEKDSLEQKLKRAGAINTQMKKTAQRHTNTIEKLEKKVSDLKSDTSKLKTDSKMKEDAYQKERKSFEEKLVRTEALEKEITDLQAEKDGWLVQAAALKATISSKKPLSSAATATVKLGDTPAADFAVQWFRSGVDGAFRVVQGATKHTYHCTADDIGCVLKATCTRLKDGLTTSAFTGRIIPHPELSKFLASTLHKDQAVLELLSNPGSKMKKFMLCNGKKCKIKHGRETKQKSEWNDEMKIVMDNKTANTFHMKFDKKGMMVKLAAKTPFDRDTVVLCVRSFNALHLYKQRQAKLPKAQRDFLTAPIQDVILALVGGRVEGETEETYTRSRMSNSVSKKTLSKAEKETRQHESQEGTIDTGNKVENSKEAEGSEKGAEKKKKGIDLSKYMGKEKEQNFWDSSDDEEQEKKIKIEIKSEEEVLKELEEKKKLQMSTSSSTVSSSAFNLGAPGGLSSSHRRRTRNSVSEDTKKGKGRRHKRKGVKSRNKVLSSTNTSMASIPSENSASTTTPTTKGVAAPLGSVTEEDKEQGPSSQRASEVSKPVSQIEEESEKEKKPVDVMDLFFGATPTPTPSNRSQTVSGVKVVVSETIDYKVKAGKVIKLGQVIGEVKMLRTGTDISAKNISVKLQGQGGGDLKFSQFNTGFLDRGPGLVDCTFPAGRPEVLAMSYAIALDPRRVPLLAQNLWKSQEKQSQAAINWFTNGQTVTKSVESTFLLRLGEAVEQCLGKSATFDAASKSFKWNPTNAHYDPNAHQLKWTENLKGNQRGRQQALVKSGKPIPPKLVNATLRCHGASTSLSGATLLDAGGAKIAVEYAYTASIEIEP